MTPSQVEEAMCEGRDIFNAIPEVRFCSLLLKRNTDNCCDSTASRHVPITSPRTVSSLLFDKGTTMKLTALDFQCEISH